MMAWKKKVEKEQVGQEPDESELPPMPTPPKKSAVKKEEPEERWSIQSVPTQTAPFVVDNGDEKVYTIEQALAKVLNNQEEILSILQE